MTKEKQDVQNVLIRTANFAKLLVPLIEKMPRDKFEQTQRTALSFALAMSNHGRSDDEGKDKRTTAEGMSKTERLLESGSGPVNDSLAGESGVIKKA